MCIELGLHIQISDSDHILIAISFEENIFENDNTKMSMGDLQ